ncbi:MAG: outer membrane beta-barrel protein [Ginsengibacter sp.]
MFFSYAFAQEATSTTSTDKKTIKLPNRAGDHFLLQVSYDGLAGMPDSISSHQQGLSRGFSAYFMFDKPFKGSPKYSIGIGAGISTSNITFKNMNVNLKSSSDFLPFTPVDSTSHFKKYKLATSYLEVPLELRYTANPDNVNKSLKAALGIKVGTLVNAHTKGKTLQDRNNNTIGSYTEKISNKRYINSTRFSATARVGYGIVSLFGTYQLNSLLKEGVGTPDMKLYQVGITISGL